MPDLTADTITDEQIASVRDDETLLIIARQRASAALDPALPRDSDLRAKSREWVTRIYNQREAERRERLVTHDQRLAEWKGRCPWRISNDAFIVTNSVIRINDEEAVESAYNHYRGLVHWLGERPSKEEGT
jgi:hypothetical protein